jgi:hypothetical protein
MRLGGTSVSSWKQSDAGAILNAVVTWGRPKLPLAALLAAAMVFGAAARARGEGRAPPEPRGRGSEPELTPEARGAIARGLAYLALRQNPEGPYRGSWEGGEYRLAVTSLAGLALLASGSTPAAGPYAENVRSAIDFVLRCRKRSGLFIFGSDSRPMYGHGFATLFLAEAYGMGVDRSRETEIRDALRAAVSATSKCQSKDGGWYYTPNSDDDEGSVTITQIQALRAARNAGIKVERRTIERAIDYIRHSQEPDGGIRYTVRYGKSSLALTAAGLAVLYGAGDYESDNVKRALAYVRAHMKIEPEETYFYYTHFYAAQAYFQNGGLDWSEHFAKVRAALLREASDDRVRLCHWRSGFGDTYATALSLLVLEIPYRYLTIYER